MLPVMGTISMAMAISGLRGLPGRWGIVRVSITKKEDKKARSHNRNLDDCYIIL